MKAATTVSSNARKISRQALGDAVDGFAVLLVIGERQDDD